MAKVLCTGADPVLLETRKLILEHAGHTVISAMNQQMVTAACNKTKFQVAVIGQSVSSHTKKNIASLVRRYCPSAKILELHQVHQARTIEDADAWLEVPVDVPAELAERVAQLAGEETNQGKA